MKKLLVIAVGILSATVSSYAASANVTISGTVASVATLSVGAGTFTLPGDPSFAVTDQQVTTVTERCNSKLGYKVTLASANAGTTAQAYLKGGSGNSDTINYSIKYNGNAVTLGAGSATVTDVTAKTTGTGVTKNLQISIGAAAADYNADTYSDTITFTLTAK